MDDKFWLNRWRENKIGFHQQAYNTQLVTFWESLRVDSGSTVFVPLCGKSRDLIWLHEQGYAVIGIELSEIAVKAYFEENGITYWQQQQASPFSIWQSDTTKLLCGDFFALKSADLESVHAVYDRASLIALPAEMRQRYVQHFETLFEKGIRILLVTLEYPQSEMQGPPFSVEESEVFDLYCPFYEVIKVFEKDILQTEENARFKAQGLTSLIEKVFLLAPA